MLIVYTYVIKTFYNFHPLSKYKDKDKNIKALWNSVKFFFEAFYDFRIFIPNYSGNWNDKGS